jgi:hypothetical protein
MSVIRSLLKNAIQGVFQLASARSQFAPGSGKQTHAYLLSDAIPPWIAQQFVFQRTVRAAPPSQRPVEKTRRD